jgi:hypothetical protein
MTLTLIGRPLKQLRDAKAPLLLADYGDRQHP